MRTDVTSREFGYTGGVHLATPTQTEIQTTIETAFALANGLGAGDVDVRALLAEAGFSRASKASDASLHRLEERVEGLRPLLTALRDLQPAEAAGLINEELTELPISPAIVDHDGVGNHLHWTPSTARFDDQVIADVLMALAQELCENGTARFGHCDASDCDDLFYDATRNHSRRFCADPRCASRTHTAHHRARKRSTTQAI